MYSPLFLVVFVIILILRHTQSQVDTSGCSSTPLKCLFTSSAKDRCQTDGDCAIGESCCYKSCFRQCVSQNPCGNVVCKPGNLCKVTRRACKEKNFHEEPSCVPAEEINCPHTSHYRALCPAGSESTIDACGCPTAFCQAKKACPTTCRIYCAYGREMKDGCPICKCKPIPNNPCTNFTCPADKECRLVVSPSRNSTMPTVPRPACMPRALSLRDRSCSFIDPTTVGFPVLNTSSRQKINCSDNSCPAQSVCVAFNSRTHHCCWQHTQNYVTLPPKPGTCPPPYFLKNSDVERAGQQPCQVDAHCAGPFKCCYINKERCRRSYQGLCLPPVHKSLSEPGLCDKPGDGRLWFLKMIKYC